MISGFLTALRFLTILPIPWKQADEGIHFKSSVKYFVPVGALIGFIVFLICKLLNGIAPHIILSVISVFTLASITGFLHLDGLADTMDGLCSARTRDKILDIMRDSRIGAMGVIGLFFVLATKILALSLLDPDDFYSCIIIMPMAGRCAMVISMTALPYARSEGGLGGMFYPEKNISRPLASFFIFVLSALLISHDNTIQIIISLMVVVFLFGLWCNKSIGGNTGDTLGALCEITEMSTALIFTCTFS